MEQKDVKMDNICRICLQKYRKMSPIFQNLDAEIEEFLSLADKISSVAQVQIGEDDGLPQSICYSCHLQVDKFHDFRVLVEMSDRTLRSYLKSEKDVTEVKKHKEVDEYKKFTTESLPDEDLNLNEVNTLIVPTDEGMEVWKICKVNKEQDDSSCENEVLSEFEPFEDSSHMEIETILMTPEMSLSEVSEKKTKVPRIQKCMRCNEFFRDRNELANHLHNHVVQDEENNLGIEIKCQICFEHFLSLQDLKTHIQDHFFDSKGTGSEINAKPDKIKLDQVDEKYFCSQCNQEFLTAEQCSKHVKKHSKRKIFRCSVCNKSFRTNSWRKKHELSHMNTRYECPQCDRIFKKKSELRYHLSCHLDTIPTCEVCKKSFQNAQSLKLHFKRHTGDSTYACKTCGKAYFTNSELNRHIQIHRGRRDYPCPLCDRSFLSKPELTRHGKYHRGEKKFKCHICSNAYYESGHLTVHIRSHTGERPFICDICNKAFISKSKLIRHQKIHFRDSVKKSEEKTGGIEN